MEKMVNYRKKTEYMTEDGRRIEEWAKVGQVEMASEEDREFKQVAQDNIYYGAIIMMVIQMIITEEGPQSVPVPKEIRFSIPNAKTIDEAFSLFYETVEQVQQEIKKNQEEEKKEPKIAVAPADAIKQIDNAVEKGGPNIIRI